MEYIGDKGSLDDNTEMTSSYHEIKYDGGGAGVEKDEAGEGSFPEGARRLFDKARHWVGDLSMDGVVSQEGQQLTYVAQDISERIKTPVKQKSSTEAVEEDADDADATSTTTPEDMTLSDLNVVINEMEIEAKRLAHSVDTLTENLTGILHSLSSMTVDCVFTASDGVGQLCDTADASIKVMYQVMAKSEELNKAVQPLYKVHNQIKDTKRLLDKVEAEMN